jgi:hypothetical protein
MAIDSFDSRTYFCVTIYNPGWHSAVDLFFSALSAEKKT